MTEQTRVLDHAEARRLAALAVDGELDASDRSALDAHLAACPACRAVAGAMRRDAESLRAMDLGPVPIAVRANVAIAAERRGRGASIGRWGVIGVVGALLIVGAASGVMGGGGKAVVTPRPSDAAPANQDAANQIAWKTDVASLTAQAFSITAGDRTFDGRTPNVQLDSDPGTATDRTLEATWKEDGVEMRLNFYFAGDDQSWWVNEIRAYDGKAAAKWIVAKGRWFESPNWQPWSGSEDIALESLGVTGKLHLVGATVATRPVDLITEPIGGGRPLAENERPFTTGGPLHCTGILQMEPADAEAALLGLGYRLSWRLETTSADGTGLSVPKPHAPDGVIIQEPAAGASGELIVFVAPVGDANAIAVPFPSDCPVADPNQTPPPPKP